MVGRQEGWLENSKLRVNGVGKSSPTHRPVAKVTLPSNQPRRPEPENDILQTAKPGRPSGLRL